MPAEDGRMRERAEPLRRRGHRAGCLLAAACLALASPSWAAEGADAAVQPEGRGYVQLRVTADGDSAAALVGTLRELVARLGLALRVTRADSAPSGFMTAAPVDDDERARVSVDEAPLDHVSVVVSAVHHGQVASPVERTIPRGESSAILAEQIGHVIHATLESLLVPGGSSSAPSPSAPAAPRAEPVAVAAERPVDRTPPVQAQRREGLSLDATVFATGRAVASKAGAVLGGGAAVDVTAWPGVGRPSLWLGGSYNAPFDEGNRDVSLQTTVTSLRGIPSVAIVGTRLLGIDVGAGAGVDVLHTVPSNQGNAMVTLGAVKDLVDPVLTAQIVTQIRVVSSARIVLGVNVDYDFGARKYVTAEAMGAHNTVFQPWPVRPSAMVGLCVPLLGAFGCAGAE